MLKKYKNFYKNNESHDFDHVGDLYLNNSHVIDGKLNKNLIPDEVDGNVYASNIGLTSLENMPRIIKGDLECLNNKITSLEHCPEQIEGLCVLNDNYITSLEHMPEHIGESMFLVNNNVKSFDGCRKNLKYNLILTGNKITSLKNCPEYMPKNNLGLYNNPLIDLENNIQSMNCMFLIKTLVKDIKDLKNINKLSIDSDKLTSVENDQLNLDLLYIKNCTNLKTIKGHPKCNMLRINKTVGFNTLEDVDFSRIKEFQAMNPNDKLKDHYIYDNHKFEYEEEFIKHNGTSINDFWTEFLNYMLNSSYNIEDYKYWPEGFLKDNLKKSNKKIKKFNL